MAVDNRAAALRDVAEQLSAIREDLRLESEDRQRAIRWMQRMFAAVAVCSALLVAGAFVGAFVLIVENRSQIRSAQQRSDQRWCGLLDSLTTNVPPPTTDRARVFARQLQELHDGFGC